MKLTAIVLTSLFALSARAESDVQAIGGNCKTKAEAAVRKKYKVSPKKQLNQAQFEGDANVFTLGFALPDNDCSYFYDVTIKPTHTVPGKDDLGHPTKEAVACNTEKREKSSDSEDCG